MFDGSKTHLTLKMYLLSLPDVMMISTFVSLHIRTNSTCSVVYLGGRITLANRTLTMLLGYDPVSRLDSGSPSDRRNLTSPILELGDKGLFHATTPMGLTVGNLVRGQV